MADAAEPLGVIDLSSALEALRGELEQAWAASHGRRLRFRVGEVSMTIQVVARREKGGGGKLRWWVIEAGAETKLADETTQTLVLTLTPSIDDDAREASPLDVHGRRAEPGG